MGKIYTIQMSQWRKAKELGVEVIDTTVKGDSPFAPTWDMVKVSKENPGDIKTQNEYRIKYRHRMIQLFSNTPELFVDLLTRDKPIALACFCRVGSFCHRHQLMSILANIAIKKGIPFEYCGELK